MADIQMFPSLTEGYEITMGNSARTISGNAALLNRFQISFFSDTLTFNGSDGSVLIDAYGGSAMNLVGNPKSISDIRSITVSLAACVSNTVESIKIDTPPDTPGNEKLSSAELGEVTISNGVIYADVFIHPEIIDSEDILRFSIPVISI